jgi:hypothetical protein
MDMAARIQALIDALPDVDAFHNPIVHMCKHDLNALPLDANSVYAWALRPDGLMLCIDHEAFARPHEPETDSATRRAALMAGVNRYPELAPLLAMGDDL